MEVYLLSRGAQQNHIEAAKEFFPGCDSVVVNSIQKLPSGFGHYEISLTITIDEHQTTLKKVTSKMNLIDNWTEDDEFEIIAPDTEINVLILFEQEIMDFITEIKEAEDEEETEYSEGEE